jgi:hypothetical protein
MQQKLIYTYTLHICRAFASRKLLCFILNVILCVFSFTPELYEGFACIYIHTHVQCYVILIHLILSPGPLGTTRSFHVNECFELVMN